jgi:hypothetical protein
MSDLPRKAGFGHLNLHYDGAMRWSKSAFSSTIKKYEMSDLPRKAGFGPFYLHYNGALR